MKIAIIGYGRMGHEVEKAALMQASGNSDTVSENEIVCRIDADNRRDFDSETFLGADVAIEFSRPEAAFDNVAASLRRGIPVVSGTTGWSDRFGEIDEIVRQTGTPMVWASNFSIGVNLFMLINNYASRLMSRLGMYAASMEEIHHIHKLDHPSGTAITLAEGIIAANPRYSRWTEPETMQPGDGAGDSLIISHRREGEVPGTHIIRWDSPCDTITLEHRAKNRSGFAMGAVEAARWLVAEKRPAERYSMSDVLSTLIEND